MTEDSGAFKTNSANFHQISVFCDAPRQAWQRCLRLKKIKFLDGFAPVPPPIFATGQARLKYSRTEPDSRCERGLTRIGGHRVSSQLQGLRSPVNADCCPRCYPASLSCSPPSSCPGR